MQIYYKDKPINLPKIRKILKKQGILAKVSEYYFDGNYGIKISLPMGFAREASEAIDKAKRKYIKKMRRESKKLGFCACCSQFCCAVGNDYL